MKIYKLHTDWNDQIYHRHVIAANKCKLFSKPKWSKSKSKWKSRIFTHFVLAVLQVNNKKKGKTLSPFSRWQNKTFLVKAINILSRNYNVYCLYWFDWIKQIYPKLCKLDTHTIKFRLRMNECNYLWGLHAMAMKI